MIDIQGIGITPHQHRLLLARIEKFISPEPMGGCWLWTGTIRKGYGVVRVSTNGKIPSVRQAHRVVFQINRGTIPDGLALDHLCMVKVCVNPNHLEPVTLQENLRRWVVSRGNQCYRGHTYDAWYRGNRICSECCRLRSKRWTERKRLRRRSREAA